MKKIEEKFAQLLQADHISLSELQAAAFAGVPDKYRPQVWALLLGYLPLKLSEREKHVQEQRIQYKEFIVAVDYSGRRSRSCIHGSTAGNSVGILSENVTPVTPPDQAPLTVVANTPRSTGDETGPSINTSLPFTSPLASLSILSPPPPTPWHSDSIVQQAQPMNNDSHNIDISTTETVNRNETNIESIVPLSFSSSSSSSSSAFLPPSPMDGVYSPREPGTVTIELQPLHHHTPLKEKPNISSESLTSSSTIKDSTENDNGSNTPSNSNNNNNGLPSIIPEWQEDEELRIEIEKDISRTCPDLNWFTQPVHTEPMARLLFVYAKLNRGVRYVQGMNEILAPLWYVFANDVERRLHVDTDNHHTFIPRTTMDSDISLGNIVPNSSFSSVSSTSNESLISSSASNNSDSGSGPSQSDQKLQEALENAEADTFFCFMQLMSEIRELFIAAHDNGELGIKGTLTRFSRVLSRREPAVAEHFRNLNMVPTFFALRWVTTLLSREFPFPEVMMLWDTLFADPTRFSFLLHMCVAMIRAQRTKLLNSDFGTSLKLLQRYPPTDFIVLLGTAMEVRAEDNADVTSKGILVTGDNNNNSLFLSSSSSSTNSNSNNNNSASSNNNPSLSIGITSSDAVPTNSLWTTPIALLGASPPPKPLSRSYSSMETSSTGSSDGTTPVVTPSVNSWFPTNVQNRMRNQIGGFLRAFGSNGQSTPTDP